MQRTLGIATIAGSPDSFGLRRLRADAIDDTGGQNGRGADSRLTRRLRELAVGYRELQGSGSAFRWVLAGANEPALCAFDVSTSQ
jgi:hypothetical protein